MGEVAILDCGAQYAKVIDRRVRELGVRSDLVPVSTRASELAAYKALIISGGPSSVYGEGAPQPDPAIFSLGKPILGICYGMQLIAQHFKGEVGQRATKEYGETTITIDPDTPIFQGLAAEQQVLMSHGDSVNTSPHGFTVIARSGEIIAGIQKDDIVGLQFHPEVDLTINGKQILRNFLFDIAKLETTHTIEDGIAQQVAAIKERVGDDNVVVLVSGGVDSAVTAALLLKALTPEQVYGIHIDHGFMRKNESKEVMEALRSLGMAHFVLVEVQDLFATASAGGTPLSQTTDPEEKRTIIGDTFMRLAETELARIPGKVFLAQGTLRPDLIESASSLVSGTAEKIKTHHNDSPLARKKREQGLIIETNVDWHKDEVREIATRLGLPGSIAQRQPFPGPGLAIRILCANAPAIVDESVQKSVTAMADDALVLPVRSVGVQGDGRTYAYPVLLTRQRRWDEMKSLASRIPRTVHQVSRVCQLLAGEAPGTFVPTTLTPENIALLQEADAIARSFAHEVAQMPVILLPLANAAGRAIVLRPFITNDFMTGRAAVIGTEIEVAQMVDALLAIEGIGAVLYDLTSKPPGTTEWE